MDENGWFMLKSILPDAKSHNSRDILLYWASLSFLGPPNLPKQNTSPKDCSPIYLVAFALPRSKVHHFCSKYEFVWN